VDPTNELLKLVSQHKYDEAFAATLRISDVSIVYSLCSQVYKFLIMLCYFIEVYSLQPFLIDFLFLG
jgi:hypothetical protein